jgi:hypothetical protein
MVRAAWMEKIMSETKCHTEVHELSLAELELVSGGLIHEGTHAGGGSSWLLAVANAMGNLLHQEAQRQQDLRPL